MGGVAPDRSVEKSAQQGLAMMKAAGRRLAVTSWNIAAINNNPFEYWITYRESLEYEKLMINVEKFLEDPGDNDVAVSKVFTEDMFSKLDRRMTGVGWTSVRSYWEADFRDRKIVSGFMKVCANTFLHRFTVNAKRSLLIRPFPTGSIARKQTSGFDARSYNQYYQRRRWSSVSSHCHKHVRRRLVDIRFVVGCLGTVHVRHYASHKGLIRR